MFNRHIYQKLQTNIDSKLKQIKQYQEFISKRKDRLLQTEKYKSRVRDFLVKMASKPYQLGQYIPPVKDILRKLDSSKNLANAQLYINGFKTNKQRLQRAVSQNKILDFSPMPVSALNHHFRDRSIQKQIQPQMHFRGQVSPKNTNDNLTSKSSVKLPPLKQNNPQVKMHFKGIQQMGNKLKSMQQKQSDRIGLMNKLQTVYGGVEIDLQKKSLQVLQSCKLNKCKTLKTFRSLTLKTQKSS